MLPRESLINRNQNIRLLLCCLLFTSQLSSPIQLLIENIHYSNRFCISFPFCSWEGEGVDEVGKEEDTGIIRVKVSPKYYRPTEVNSLKNTSEILLKF